MKHVVGNLTLNLNPKVRPLRVVHQEADEALAGLRRRFAQRLLVDNGMNPRVVMAVGGWSSFEAIQPYLNTPTESVVNQAFEAIE